MSVFIAIDGCEGSGKSTAIKFIINLLKEMAISFVNTREPGGTVVAEKIRHLLLHHQTDESLTPLSELLLIFAARSQHITEVIEPALKKGQWVICDRFIESTYAYQGGGRQIPLQIIDYLTQQVVGSWRPNLNILLDLDPEIGLDRIKKNDVELDRIEKEKIEFFRRVRLTYLKRAANNKNTIIIDASLPTLQIENKLKKVITGLVQDVKN